MRIRELDFSEFGRLPHERIQTHEKAFFWSQSFDDEEPIKSQHDGVWLDVHVPLSGGQRARVALLTMMQINTF